MLIWWFDEIYWRHLRAHFWPEIQEVVSRSYRFWLLSSLASSEAICLNSWTILRWETGADKFGWVAQTTHHGPKWLWWPHFIPLFLPLLALIRGRWRKTFRNLGNCEIKQVRFSIWTKVSVLFKSLDFTETNVVLVTLIRLRAVETHSQVYDQGVNELN